jgi:adenosylcobinamide kinase / adenosylcobinamide-phosphate guanylyltransferase
VTGVTLILGGARSGKSSYAERLARERGADEVWFVATAEPLDEEMRERIRGHQANRPAAWLTLEAPRAVAGALRAVAGRSGMPRLVLLDCLTLLASNVLLEADGSLAAAKGRLEQEVEALLDWRRECGADLVLVSNEVGWGLVPVEPLGRAYRDLLGWANARVATAADEVLLMVAGIPVPIRSR